MPEEWRTIPGFSAYEVSSDGRVRSIARTIIKRDGRKYSLRGKPLRMPPGNGGYLRVNLRRDDGGREVQRVHALVCRTFYGPAQPGQVVRHLNGDPADNRVVNLQWGTESENQYDRVAHGRHHNANKTHCNRGHEFNEMNTYAYSAGRNCRACARETARQRKSARSGKGAAA